MNLLVKTLLTVGATASLAACQKSDSDGHGAKDKASEHKGAEDKKAATTPPAANDGPKPGDIPAPPDVAIPPSDAKKTEKGVSYKVLTPGKEGGAKPAANDSVEVHYTGWTTDGKMFDSSVSRGKPATFGLKQVIPGWTDGLQTMTEGEKTRLWIPVELAYNGRPGKPQGMLVFDVELLKVIEGPKTPADVAAPPANAKKTKLGVSYRVIKSGGKKQKPNAWDRVKVDYTGWTTDGEMFDSSKTRGQPAEFALNQVIPGWTDGLQLMSVGDTYRLWIPEEHAYQGRPGAPKGMLVFDVELLEVKEMPKPPEAPKDVAEPPKNAQKTEKGVFYTFLAPEKGGKKPTAQDTVEVHYSGWTTDGKMFDSSVTRGQTATFPLSGVIPGWTDGLQVMGVGDKARFWIPKELAYDGKPGKPQGMLVFDVELVSIK